MKWSYTQQVALLLAPKIELRNEVLELLKEVIPTLTEVEGEWIMTADFENYAIDSSETYHIIIPGSTVVTPEGDVVVNKESALRIANGVVGINEVNHKALSLACLNNQLHIAGTTEGDHVVLYTVEGRTIASHLAEETNTTLASP